MEDPPSPQPEDAPQPAVRRQRAGLRDDPGRKGLISITGALKTNAPGSSSSYITYVIHNDETNSTTNRRYSEFESLRAALGRLCPVLIIPPIPPHHSISTYASHPSKAKEDASVIARRKRMLAVFLNRCNRHPILGHQPLFQRFLMPNLSWNEIITQSPLPSLPKNPLKTSAKDPTNAQLIQLFASLPLPSSSANLQEPDNRFVDSETFTNKFSSHLSGSLEKVNRRVMKRWADLAADWAELGAVLNGWSLLEAGNHHPGADDGQLAEAIEILGQAVDSTYINTNSFLQAYERVFTEPLQSYTQSSAIIKQLLKYRHAKQAQCEMTREVLETKRSTLVDLERSEVEARRLEMALDRALLKSKAPPGEAEQVNDRVTTDDALADLSASTSKPATAPSKGFLSAVTHTISSLTDSDPVATRRSNIGKTREAIALLEGSINAVAEDLQYANITIQADLDRFQRQKVGDLKEMSLGVLEAKKEWCLKNLEMWQEAKNAAEKIPGEEKTQ